jgi:adenine C2-methylase RlmN of 23S rRNA A2503 and tRNA A37
LRPPVRSDYGLAFVGKLHAAGVATQRRYSGRKDEHAACGMLAAQLDLDGGVCTTT